MENDTAPQTPKSRLRQKFWETEIKQSCEMLRKWHEQADKIIDRYCAEDKTPAGHSFRTSLFYSHVSTLESMLYGNLPRCTVKREHQDAKDDVGRVAGNIIERALNLDISCNGEEYDSVLRNCLHDRLVAGLGAARVRYEEAGQYGESVKVDYYNWRDVAWGWGRNWSEIPWLAFRNYLTKQEIETRFPDVDTRDLQFKKQAAVPERNQHGDEQRANHETAEVWEIWDRETKTVVFYSEGAKTLLQKIPDPLELKGFFPAPPFLIANPTTRIYCPVPDYRHYQDLYAEVDRLSTRISMLTAAMRVVGVFDSRNHETLKKMLQGHENDMIPVENWAMFGEQGGMQGVVDWFPLETVATTLANLRDLRQETIALLNQVTGISDVMTGGLQNQYEGVGQSQMKLQSGSVRVQHLQDTFSRFASDLMQIKAEVIGRICQPETIAKMGNVNFLHEDPQTTQQAVQLIKSWDQAMLRVNVQSETIAMVDYARLKTERIEFLTSLATFMQSAGPLLEQQPNSLPVLLEMLQWTMAGFRGSQEIEGVLDKAVQAAQEEAKKPKPDPEAEKEKARIQAELQKIQAKAQADMQTRQADLQADIQTIQAQTQARLQELQTSHQAKMAELRAKLEGDQAKAQMETSGNLAETAAALEAEQIKAAQDYVNEINDAALSAQNKIDEEMAKSELKIDEEVEKSRLKRAENRENGGENGA